MEVTEVGRMMEVKPWQFMKANLPTDLTDEGISKLPCLKVG